LARQDGTILGKGFSSYKRDAVRSVFENAGLGVTSSGAEWSLTWPDNSDARSFSSAVTLYITMEPSAESYGTTSPPTTKLIELAGIPRVVIGTLDPMAQNREKGANALRASGIDVIFGTMLQEECNDVIQQYVRRANSKLHLIACEHFNDYGRPLGFIDGDTNNLSNSEALSRIGNAVGQWFNRKTPQKTESIWAHESFYKGIENHGVTESEFPWYGHADAYVVTIPAQENVVADKDSDSSRFADLEWLATAGSNLPAGLERIVVVDATDLKNLPIVNGGPTISPNVNIEALWAGRNRKATRIILKRGGNMKFQSDAKTATVAAQDAVDAAAKMAAAIESGDTNTATEAVEAAIQRYRAAQTHAEQVFIEFREAMELRRKLELKGVVIDVIEGGLPIDVMNHVAATNAYRSMVWRGSHSTL
jgi:pyrimidine deaminase RibD-like protein